ncbi:molybdate ABC transporter substrate-binding protein [Ferrimonas pelagia]|uniref:Molybdate ABC transporter substrate-binding protein n=1 Tax=Ferrimonas pelagia TaxID=1177826 RepID=A0ABP9F0M4_9GAMM
MRCIGLLAVMWLACSPAWAVPELNVAVAANFRSTLAPLAEQFEQENDVKVRLSSGASGALYTQILHGAPFDLFLSADNERPELLAQQELIIGQPFTYATGVLAYWQPGVPGESVTKQHFMQWQGRLAMANPRIAPYGEAAREVLERSERTDEFGRNIVRGSNILQTFQYVESGNVAAGFVALAQLHAFAVPASEYWVVPAEMHTPILQQGVVLKRTDEPELARQLVDFLLTQEGALTDAGYRLD